MGDHLVDGQFKSDKYAWCPPGFLPLKLTDPMASDLVLEYAKRRREVDKEFADDLTAALKALGVTPENAKIVQLVEAVLTWAADCEGWPGDPNDARLLKAIWTYDGDRTKPCPECDGDCGEPCAPCTVAAAHAMLDKFSAEWLQKRGIKQVE